MALMLPPEKPPWRTSKSATTSWNSWIASRLIGVVLAWPPGVPWSARPNRSLFTAPSIWMLLKRVLRPAIETADGPSLTDATVMNGLVRAKSSKPRFKVGRFSTSKELTLLVEPVRLELMIGSRLPTTVTASSMVPTWSWKSATSSWPKRTKMSVCSSGRKPSSWAVRL